MKVSGFLLLHWSGNWKFPIRLRPDKLPFDKSGNIINLQFQENVFAMRLNRAT